MDSEFVGAALRGRPSAEIAKRGAATECRPAKVFKGKLYSRARLKIETGETV